MKKLIVFLFAITLISVGFAQTPFALGIKAGYTGSQISTNISDIETDIHNGFLAGGFFRLKLKKFYVQPEVYFAVKGGELKYNLGDIDPNNPEPEKAISQTVKMSVVDVPVLLGYKLLDPPMMNLRIHAGPVASFILDKEMEIKAEGIQLDNPDINNTLKDANFGIQVGAGVDVLIFTIDVRYEFGLSNIYDKPENATGNLEEYKNNVFLVSLGWKIIP